MKSVILCSLLVVSLVFALYGKDDFDWSSGNPDTPKQTIRTATPVDTTEYINPNRFISKSEYDRYNINSRFSETSFYTSNTIGIPIGRFEAVMNLDKYDYDVMLGGYYEDWIPYTDRLTSMEMMCKYNLKSDWKIGLGIIFKEDYTAKITFNHYLKLELSKQAEQDDSKFGFKAYIEESLEKGSAFENDYNTTGFYPPGKGFNQSANHWGTELYYCLSNPANLVTVETNYPLTFAMPQSFYIAGGLDYTYTSSYDWVNETHNYVYAREGWLQLHYKIIKQLEFTFYSELNEHNIDRKHRSIDYYYTWLDAKPGLTAYLIEYKNASLMMNASYLHQYYHRDTGDKESHSLGNIVPSIILTYKFNDHLLLNGMFTRQYYTGDPDKDLYYTLDRTWDVKLGMTMEY